MPPMPADTVPVHCHKLHAHPETTRLSIRARSFSIAGGGEEREHFLSCLTTVSRRCFSLGGLLVVEERCGIDFAAGF